MDPTPLWYYRGRERWCPDKESRFDHRNHRQGNILSNPQTEGLLIWQYDMKIIQRMTVWQSQKPWKDSIANTPAWPKSKAVVNFLLLTGHNCLAKYLYHIGLFSHLYCTLFDQQEETDRHHLLSCTALSSTSENKSYWEAGGEWQNEADNVPAICINK
jgi:hypothetical protein